MKQIYQPKNILITGGAGFIGSHFVLHMLKEQNCQNIINLDALTYAACLSHLSEITDHPRYQFIKGDICDRGLIDSLLHKYNIDTIVHFAAESHVDRSIVAPNAFIQTNVMGTFNLLEAARNYWLKDKSFNQHNCRFHHISTDEVYGSLTPDMSAFSETTPYAPNSPYSASKASSDHLVRAYYHTYELPMTMTNCSNNYGPHQHEEKFIPTVIRSCLNWQPIPIYGNGKNIRDWLYVEDHCYAIDRVIKSGKLGENYNIGGEAEHENLKVVELICHIMDELFPRNDSYRSLISFVSDRLGHDFRYAINIEKARTTLGWAPATRFEEGLRKTVQWYCQNNFKLASPEKNYERA